MAYSAGIRGLVCSPNESKAVKLLTDAPSLLVVPGIRPEHYPPDDQKRIATPSQAIAGGADYLVVGRPITQSVRPIDMVKSIQREIVEACNNHHDDWEPGGPLFIANALAVAW